MPSLQEHNGREIANLRRWRRRASLIYFTSLAAIPLGLVCPCGVAVILKQAQIAPDAAQTVALSGLLLPLVGLAGTLLMLGDRRRSRRSLDLVALADARGLDFTYQPSSAALAQLADFTSLLPFQNSGSGVNLLEGTFKKRPLLAVDYAFNYLFANRVLFCQQTVVMFVEGFEETPPFTVLPRSWADRFEQAILGSRLSKTFEVPDEKEFNRHFAVVGGRRKEIVACLSPEMIDLLLEDKQLVLEVSGGKLLLYRRDQVLAVCAYEEFLLQASRMAQALARRASAG